MITQENLNQLHNKKVYIENCEIPILNNYEWIVTACLMEPIGYDNPIIAFMDVNYTLENKRWYTIECDQKRLGHLLKVMKVIND